MDDHWLENVEDVVENLNSVQKTDLEELTKHLGWYWTKYRENTFFNLKN